MTLSVLVAGLALANATTDFDAGERHSKIDAVWIDLVGCASDPRDVERTVDDTLRPLQVDVQWKEARPSDPTEPRELRVVLTTPTRWARDSNVLGAFIPTSSTPTVWVEYENVLRTLGLLPQLREPSDQDRLARALARVIAHELVHVLVPEYGHDMNGLLAPWLDGSGLVEPEMRWSPTLVRWFREGRGRGRRRKTPVEPEALIAEPGPEAPARPGRTN